MEDEKTKEGSVTSPSFHPSKTSSPKKVDVENAPQDGKDETAKTLLETKSPKKVDVENAPQDGNDETTKTLIETKSPKKVDVENAHQDGNDKTTQIIGTKSAQDVDIPTTQQNLPNNSEPLKKDNENNTEAKLNEPVQESVDRNSSISVVAQQEPTKRRTLLISYSSPAMKTKDGANASSKMEQGYSSSPIAPVKHTVSRFGGIIDWKAHKQHTLERRKFIQLELEKANEEIPVFKKQREAAEEEKQQILKKLNSTKRVNEDLKLNLERARVEEQQARQDAELAILRMEELEKGIADEASVACKAQLELARARYDAAVVDLKAVQDELELLQQDFTLLSAEKESAIRKAKESVAESKEVEKSLEDSSIELINTKDSLESAQAGHLEAEEKRAEETTALEQEVLKFENELREAEEELEKLNQKFSSAKNAKAQLATSLELLQKLKGELDVYMESNLKKGKDENEEKNRGEIEAAVKSAKMELEQTQAYIKKAIDEVKSLKEAASSLNSELETQKSEIITINQRDGTVCMQGKKKETKGKMVELPDLKKLLDAAHDANQAKPLVELRREEYRKAKEEARQANNEKSMVENRFLTAQKEIEVAKAAEKLAFDSINEQQESESADTIIEEDSQTKVPLTLEEYYEHNMRALEAEDDANKKVLITLSEIDAAKESELESRNKLNEINNDISHIKKEREIALQKVKIAKERKLYAEEDLRKWRSKQQLQKEAEETLRKAEEKKQSENSKKLSHLRSQKSSGATTPGPEDKPVKKKKKFVFPRFFMFMGKRKSSSKPS